MKKLINEAVELFQKGHLEKSKEVSLKLLEMDQDNFDALYLLGIISFHLKEYQQSFKFLDKAIIINSNIPDLYNIYSLVLCQVNNFKEALKYLDKAIDIKPNYFDAFYNKGNVYFHLNEYDKSIENYKKSLSINPKNKDALNNLGNVYNETKSYINALDCYEKALGIDTNNSLAFYNKGKVLKALNRLDEAIISYNKAIELNKNFSEAYKNLGNLFLDKKKYNEAIFNHKIALKIDPNITFLGGTIIQSKCSICDWTDIENDKIILENNILSEKKFSNPFPVISLIDSPSLQKKVSEIFVKDLSNNIKKIEKYKYKQNKKIRLGYFSSDFHSHATSHLMVELFEYHNKDKFEIYAFSFGKNDNSEIRNRLNKSFDKFFDVSLKSNDEIINICNENNIDIAIDLKGFTDNNRFGLFIQRCAPIQISYLGYPGTTGCNTMDYLIADSVLISDQNRKFYTEKIIYMPNSYQINESKKKISTKKFTRKDFGLNEDSFVFCCFNQTYKILPEIFNLWVKILKNVENSIIWLLSDNKISELNLKKEFNKNGIDVERIKFAQRLPLDEHLKRHSLADLFLDTYPCNAHTTASDALRTGLPLITLSGQSFASRVSASLLVSLDLNELITDNQDDYVNLAVKLAKNNELLNEIRNKLKENIKNKSLFNSKLFTKNIEIAFEKVYENYSKGKKPDHINI